MKVTDSFFITGNVKTVNIRTAINSYLKSNDLKGKAEFKIVRFENGLRCWRTK